MRFQPSPKSVDAAMIHDSNPQFVFMTCRPGAESALKQELARSEPTWHPAFSRPGYLTFKLNGPKPLHDEQLAARSWVFARAHGLSLGQISGTELARLADQVWRLDGLLELVAAGPPVDVHVWQRDAEPNEGEPMPTGVTPLALEIETSIRAAAPDQCSKLRDPPTGKRRPTRRNARVLDVVVIEPNHWCVGYHRTATRTQSWPGGVIPLRLPEHAVSRAYAKLEEALAWSGLPLAAGDECVEIGSAPGGACQALLDRGMFVTGIDPAEMDPAVAAHPRFRQLRMRGKEVRRSEFVGVRWLAADVNLAPLYTLDTVESIVNHPQVSIRGLILTLKMADWSQAARLPEFAARVHGWGFRDVRLRQLASGGQEVCLVALRRKELRRLDRKRKPRRRGEPASAGGQRRTDPPQSTLSGPHF
jgi:23S rRNA (cytidine2498-2'-O)-methyltransferase